MDCAFCGGHLNTGKRVSRNDSCPHCGKDIRCCKQCKFYDPHAYNGCREVAAERIVDKERANFCDYYVLRGSVKGKVNRTQDAKKALEALFRK